MSLPQCMLGYHTPQSRHPPGADTPGSRHPPEQTPPESIYPPGSRHPPEQTPPESRYPPRSRHPPEQTPPWEQTLLPGSRLRHTVNDRPVRILLECILVLKRVFNSDILKLTFFYRSRIVQGIVLVILFSKQRITSPRKVRFSR